MKKKVEMIPLVYFDDFPADVDTWCMKYVPHAFYQNTILYIDKNDGASEVMATWLESQDVKLPTWLAIRY